MDNYKNKVSKYQNKLNQVGGACPFKNGDIVMRKDNISKYGIIVGLILNNELQTCNKLYVKLENGEVEIWNLMDVGKDNLDQVTDILLNTNTLGMLPLPNIIKLFRTGHPGIQNAIKVYRKYDFYDQEPLQDDVSLREFNEMFPFCKGLNISDRRDIIDADFVYLRGIKRLNITWCSQITDIALVHLRGIHTLNMKGCYRTTDIALVHLRGIHILNMESCFRISNAAFIHLRGIHTLYMIDCIRIKNAAFINLRGIHKLNMNSCRQITDAAFVHLSGIHYLKINFCDKITDAAFVHLSGIHTLYMIGCDQPSITNNAFHNLIGIRYINMRGCNEERIAYARRIGLPVTF